MLCNMVSNRVCPFHEVAFWTRWLVWCFRDWVVNGGRGAGVGEKLGVNSNNTGGGLVAGDLRSDRWKQLPHSVSVVLKAMI